MNAAGHHPLTLVAAVARNGVIGAKERMPWSLPGDLAEFRRITIGHPLLMGRATYESIGRPLPGRLTTVVSSRMDSSSTGVAIARSLAEGLDLASRQADQLGAETIMVVGGGRLYAATIGRASTLLITAVDLTPLGDTIFPPIDPAIWRQIETRPAAPLAGDTAGYSFTRWKRRDEPPWDRGHDPDKSVQA